MTTMIKRISGSLLMVALFIVPQILFTSCSDSNSSGGGTPEITGVRSCDPAAADSLLTWTGHRHYRPQSKQCDEGVYQRPRGVLQP